MFPFRSPLKRLEAVILLILLCGTFQAKALLQAEDDAYTVNFGDAFPSSIFTNDEFDGIPLLDSGILPEMQIEFSDPCFELNDEGFLIFSADASEDFCCGPHELTYTLFFSDFEPSTANIFIDVQCGKPDCAVVNLDELTAPVDDGDLQQAECANVCANSSTQLFVANTPGTGYTWTMDENYTQDPGSPNVVQVEFEDEGTTEVTLTIEDSAGNISVAVYCFNVLEAPEAQFVTDGYACLNTPMTFENLFPNAAAYEWDFGDGAVVTNDGQFVQHTYAAPGSYTVTLTATNIIYGDDGDALCCCFNEMQMDVEVDALEGPVIECISTLCEGDQATYTTDAVCSAYTWQATDADGNVIASASGPDAFFTVNWGSGPFGIVSLEVSGCTPNLCTEPTEVVIPIISALEQVVGPDIVCQGETATYVLPKWLGVNYQWSVTGGSVLHGNGTHMATIQWGNGPAGSIEVNYNSAFLQGLEGNTASDCQGLALLDVAIRPAFNLSANALAVCVNDNSSIIAQPAGSYNWTIDPAAPFTDFGNSIQVDWTTGPGNYTVTAMPVDPTDFCNQESSIVIQVDEAPLPGPIAGPLELCSNEFGSYTLSGTVPGATVIWSAPGSSTPSFTGTVFNTSWPSSGSYTVSAQQQVPGSGCISDPVQLEVTVIELNGPIEILGDALCNNSTASYTADQSQPAETVWLWEVSPPQAGSITTGQGTDAVTVQWNNYTGPVFLSVSATLCAQTLTDSVNFTLVAAQEPEIVQNGNLCPGGSGSLETTQPFASYEWSTAELTASINVSNGGVYSVITTDANGCEAQDFYEAIELPSPIASLTSPNFRTICIEQPHTVNLVAETGTDYEFTWTRNGTPVQGPGPNSNYTHIFQGGGTFEYIVTVTDTGTGCTDSDTLSVFEIACPDTEPCDPEGEFNPSASVSSTFCNQVDFDSGAISATVTLWDFGDDSPVGSGQTTTHTYSTAGCYNVYVEGTTPDLSQDALPGDVCVIWDTTSVCVPIASDFTYEFLGCNEVQFNEEATVLGSPYGSPVNSYSWLIDGNVVNMQNPLYSFPGPGTYDVTLTVTNSTGCQATSVIKQVDVGGVGPASINASNLTPCEGETVTFTATSPGAVDFEWIFGDGAAFVGNPAEHVYAADGAFPVTLLTYGPFGCVDSTGVTLQVLPGVPPGVISGPLAICQGEQATLMAPPGDQYLWTNGLTDPSITVGAGTYGVTVTNANGCSREFDEVTVIETPAPAASISGDAFICDNGCVTLSTPFNADYDYEWGDSNGNTGVGNIYSVCSASPLPVDVVIQVTDLTTGCVASDGPFTVGLGASPAAAISLSGDGCAGSINTLSVVAPDPAISYTWSTGESSNSIQVSAAGDYLLTATDPVSGCASTVSQIINPLPDLCSVPVGCYEDCDSSEVCIAPGLGTYQWFQDGSLISGAASNCLTMTQSGSYTVEVTSFEGCSIMSDPIQMTIVPCGQDPCEDVEATVTPLTDADGNQDACCASVGYLINNTDVFSLQLTSPDASLNLNTGSVDPDFAVQSNTSTEIRVANLSPVDPLPQGAESAIFDFCLTDPVNLPQLVVFDWLNQQGEIICQDSIFFECAVEPDCVYVLEDSAYCEAGSTFYDFTVCNPADADYSIGYLELTGITPVGAGAVPNGIDITSNPLQPGECRSFTLELTGSGIGGQQFCYTLVGHEADPVLDPTTLCCSLEQPNCIDLPQCDPCGDVFVDSVLPTEGEGCCYTISLLNNHAPDYFDEIAVYVSSPGTELTVNNPAGSGWFTSGITSTSVNFTPDALLGGNVPAGLFTLPEICFATTIAPPHIVVIEWIQNGVVVCESDIEVFCEPDCGYMSSVNVECDEANAAYLVSGLIHNNTDYTVSEAVITFPSGSGLTAYNTTIVMGATPPGGVAGPFDFAIGSPAAPGDIVCFNVTIHEVNADGFYLSCCTFEVCVEIPDCNFVNPCICDDTFAEAVAAGVDCVDAGGGAFEFSLSEQSAFSDCDQVRWSFGDGNSAGPVSPFEVVSNVYPAPGTYQLCIKVYRVDENGDTCVELFCKDVEVLQGIAGSIVVFPNPTNGLVRVVFEELKSDRVDLTIFDALQRPVEMLNVATRSRSMMIPIDLSAMAEGIYFLQISDGEDTVVRRIMITR